MFPFMYATISSWLGFLFNSNSAAACIIWPDWQYPHCGTCASTQAFWSGWDWFFERPSIVVTDFPAKAETGVMHDLIGWPFRWTVQAPHSPEPHPNLVPVSFRCSRSTHSNVVSGCGSSLVSEPFNLNSIDIQTLSIHAESAFRYYCPDLSKRYAISDRNASEIIICLWSQEQAVWFWHSLLLCWYDQFNWQVSTLKN